MKYINILVIFFIAMFHGHYMVPVLQAAPKILALIHGFEHKMLSCCQAQ